MNNREINIQSPFRDLGPQLSIFEKLPKPILEKEWFKDHIKNPPPFSSEEQRRQAQEKLNQYSSLQTARNEAGSNLTNKLQLS